MFIVKALLGGLLLLVSTFVGKVLFALGMGYMVFRGIDATMAGTVDQILIQYGKLPSDLKNVLAYMQVGSCINIILSGVSIRLMLMGLHSDTITKLINVTSEP